MEINIVKININKMQISLMDGSLWRLVNAGDISTISIWYPPQRVEVEDEDGQFIMTNLETFAPDKVRVSRLA
jgi:hypothetical protein